MDLGRRDPALARTALLVPLLLVALLAETVVNLDQFAAAALRTFSSANHRAKRPPTYNLTFALLVGGGGYLFFGGLTTAWVVFAALTSHVLRNASVGTAPVLWPLGDWRIAPWARQG